MFKPVPIKLKRGEAVFHHPLAVHGSLENRYYLIMMMILLMIKMKMSGVMMMMISILWLVNGHGSLTNDKDDTHESSKTSHEKFSGQRDGVELL